MAKIPVTEIQVRSMINAELQKMNSRITSLENEILLLKRANSQIVVSPSVKQEMCVAVMNELNKDIIPKLNTACKIIGAHMQNSDEIISDYHNRVLNDVPLGKLSYGRSNVEFIAPTVEIIRGEDGIASIQTRKLTR